MTCLDTRLRPRHAGGTGTPALIAVARRRARRGLVAGGLVALALLAGSGAGLPRASHADIHAGFLSPSIIVAPGDTFTVYLAITVADAEFNAFDASLRFDPAMLSFEPITPVGNQRGSLMTGACTNTFHLFSAAPDSLKITLSLLCSNTFVAGPGTIYRVRFRAGLTEGLTTLSLGPFTEFYRAGLFARPLDKSTMSVTIGTPVGVASPSPESGDLDFAPVAPNPRRGGSAVSLEFRLPSVDVVSVELLDVQGRRVALRAPERLAAGRHRLSWTPPALAAGAYRVLLSTASGGRAVRALSVLR